MSGTVSGDGSGGSIWDSLGNSFSNPGMMALLGAAQGFGRAAMPTPYKLPFGAVLAQGLGGMAGGVHDAYANQVANQQAQSGQLQLDQQKAMQPFILAQNKAMAQSMTGALNGQGGAGGGDPNAPLIDPHLAAMLAIRSAADPKSSRGASAWLDYLKNFASGPVVNQAGGVTTPTGSNEALAGRTVAQTMAGVPAKVAAAWGTVAPALAKEGLLAAPDGTVTLMPGYAAAQGVKAGTTSAASAWGGVAPDLAKQGMTTAPDGSVTPTPGFAGTKADQAGSVTAAQRWAALPPDLQKSAMEAGFRVQEKNDVIPAVPGQVPNDPFPQWAQQITGAENGTGNPAARNASGPGGTPTSSAMGNGQFLDQTWPQVLRAVRPDLTAGKSDAQLLPLRADPQLAQSATEAYARQNAGVLSQNGFPVTGATVAMAHGLGPQGAMAILRSVPTTPTSLILPKPVLDANPQLQGKTAGDVQAMYQQRMAPPVQPLAPGIKSQAAPGGGQVITNTRPLQEKSIHEDDDEVSQLLDHSKAAQDAQNQILNLRNSAANVPTGAGATQRAELSNWITTYLGPKAAKAMTGLDAASAQEIVKQTLTAAGGAERETLGARGGIGAITMYRNAFPGMETQPTAFHDMTNLLAVAQQRTIDEANAVTQAHTNSRQSYINGQGDYVTNPATRQEFNASHPPTVYVGAAAALNNKPYQQWSKGLTPTQQQEALRIAWRTDPSAQITGMDGKTVYTNPALSQAQGQGQ